MQSVLRYALHGIDIQLWIELFFFGCRDVRIKNTPNREVKKNKQFNE